MTKRNFLALGECMLELSPTQGTQDMSWGFAGDTFNTAWYAARLFDAAWQVSYFTGVGEDKISQEFLDFARGSGLDVSKVARCAGRTLGLYMIHLEEGERSFTYWRSESAARLLGARKEALEHAFMDAEVLYFSGISIAILDAQGRQNLHESLVAARAIGKTVVFDPNLRPKLWTSVDEMLETTTQFAECSNVVMPSFEDEQVHFGDADIAAAATRYGDLGADLIVVKNGDQEILVQQGTERAQFVPKPVTTPVDTTAAGDSFNAGFLSAHLSGAPLEDAVRAGCDLAVQVIGARGALIDCVPLR